MKHAEIGFWILAAIVAYTYIVYPMTIALLARFAPRPVRRVVGHRESVSIVLAAYNEEATIGRRIDELLSLIAVAGVDGEVIIVSDGSTDHTVERARAGGHASVTVIEQQHNLGKAAALNAAREVAKNAILVFADARQTWAPDALNLLLENFADKQIGAVSGELILESSPGVMAGVGMYWRYEKWLRQNEGRVHSNVGVTGAICAVRRELFQPIPAGTILDDVYWPTTVVMQRYRVVHDQRAKAFDRLPAKAKAEFQRKVRTMSGNYQLVASLPSALLPWRNPVLWQFVSHKLLRLVVPWALLGMLVLSAALLPATFYRLALAAQLAFYVFGLASLTTRWATRLPMSSAVASFIVLNSAAGMGLWVWISGQSVRSWKKTTYDLPAAASASSV